VEMCEVGMHASRRPIDALKYAPGPVVCRVRVWGDIQEDVDKLVGRNREVLWMADATRELHQFGVWCVRHTPLADGRTVWDLLTDPRSRNAVETKELWLRGEATDSDLRAACSAADGAACRAANGAAWNAAKSAAYSAAYGAARSAQNTKLSQLMRRLARRKR